MPMKMMFITLILGTISLFILPNGQAEETVGDGRFVQFHSAKEHGYYERELPEQLARFTYDSGYSFSYLEDGVRGLYNRKLGWRCTFSIFA
ncbi:hypothetical protein [Halalkalibacterium ligniniphilum]|uniref:hypothetical protein n=1 Tax=Halalkalibacterium ligniniphilum TaxID=1134413 RepID=UPI00034DD153|nr:hypothetical protein [Halalkalibacterium ligniniphilum]